APVRDVAPWVPPDLAFAIEHALVKDPNGRWSSAEAFARALRAASLGDHVVIATPPESRATPYARTSIAPGGASTEPMHAPPTSGRPMGRARPAGVTAPAPHRHEPRRRSLRTTAGSVASAVGVVVAVITIGLVLRTPETAPTTELPTDEAHAIPTPIPS